MMEDAPPPYSSHDEYPTPSEVTQPIRNPVGQTQHDDDEHIDDDVYESEEHIDGHRRHGDGHRRHGDGHRRHGDGHRVDGQGRDVEYRQEVDRRRIYPDALQAAPRGIPEEHTEGDNENPIEWSQNASHTFSGFIDIMRDKKKLP